MALVRYHNIVGSGTREKELIGVGDNTNNEIIKSIRLTNIHTTDDAEINLYLYRPSSDTSDEETYYIEFQLVLGEKSNRDISGEFGLLNFDNSEYALIIEVGSGNTVDVIIGI